MTIAIAGKEDAGALADLGARTFTDKFGDLYRPEDLAAFLAETHTREVWEDVLTDPDYRVWKVIGENGDILAYGMTGPVQLPVDPPIPVRAIELKRLYVDKSAQGTGMGTRLLEDMLDWIDKDGPRPVYLSVYKYNDGAQRLYERYGFSLVKEITFKVGEHYDPELLYARCPKAAG